jgi:hypothetical protein
MFQSTTPAARLVLIPREVFAVKNIFEVLRSKEQEILRVRKELDALRIAARLLTDDMVPTAGNNKATHLVEMPDSDELLDIRASEQPTA